jgi:ferredoxin
MRPTPSGSTNVRILRQHCCGNAECVEIAPDVFALDSKGRAVVLDAEAAPLDSVIEAARACPCGAIVVEDEAGNLLGP